MTLHRARRTWLAAGAVVLTAGLASPTLAGHVLPGEPVAPQATLTELGVSGSSQTFLLVKGFLYCYTGTLGALVQDASGQYILSNNHVLAKENGNLNSGGADGTIIQPGLLDEGPCTLSSGNPDHAVAILSEFVTIKFAKGKNKPLNTVDAAIAKVLPSQVDANGAILGIGPVDDLPGSVATNTPVQKTGRTTAHTFGKVMATNVTLDVSYDSGTARFANQIRIRKPCGDAGFSDAGDSGSLIVTVPDTGGGPPSAVGLLFAGGGSDTFANPIGPVLSSLGVSMVAGVGSTDSQATLSAYQPIADNCPTSGGGRPGRPRGAPPGLAKAKDVATRHSNRIFALPDVVGHGIGADEHGDAVIEIYVKTKGRQGAGGHPSDIEGVPVSVIETGPIRAY
jgi:hypothetical protein